MSKKNHLSKKLNSLLGSLSQTCESFRVDGDRLLKEVATDLFESLNTPVSLSCEILLRYGDIAQLVSKKVDPSVYNCPFDFRHDYQAVSFLKKVPYKNVGLDATGTAKAKFYEAEEQCRQANLRIRNFLIAPEKASDVVFQAFCLASRKIELVLGSLDYNEWLNGCRFGPGSFTHPKARGLTSVYDKLQVDPTVTPCFREQGAILVKSSPSWCRSLTGMEEDGFWPLLPDSAITTVPGNRVMFVPKTAVTERAIAVEPLLNIYGQLGIGACMRRRLRRVRVNLNDQAPNQESALKGSLDGSLSTIDLSMASDTVSRELVRALVPDEWYAAMNSCRSKTGVLDGKTIVYEKFSSMGNGFTFELESLIFWAFATSACVISEVSSREVRVYGDDIVVPVEAFDVLEEILQFFGFTLNRLKSFKKGVFRESCGKDYYNGVDVRPLHVKELPERLDSLFVLANGLRRHSHRWDDSHHSVSRLYRAWRQTVHALPGSVFKHCKVPAHAGDADGLISTWDEAQTSAFVRPSKDGWEGWHALRYQSTPVRVKEVTNFLGAAVTLMYRLKDGFVEEYTQVYPTQGRDFVYRLRAEAFYGPWTELTHLGNNQM